MPPCPAKCPFNDLLRAARPNQGVQTNKHDAKRCRQGVAAAENPPVSILEPRLSICTWTLTRQVSQQGILQRPLASSEVHHHVPLKLQPPVDPGQRPLSLDCDELPPNTLTDLGAIEAAPEETIPAISPVAPGKPWTFYQARCRCIRGGGSEAIAVDWRKS